MAVIKNGMKRGREGDVIHSSWHGRPYTRRMPETVANPQTEAQQAHRNAFAEISRLSSAMKEGHKIGLHWYAVRQKLNTHSVFKSLNKNCYGANGIDYPHVVISRGSVSIESITSANIGSQGDIHVTFCGCSQSSENKNDEFYLFVFCPDLCAGHFAQPVARSIGRVDAQIPDEWLGHALHLYAFMRNRKGQTSDTIYVGEYSLPAEW